jgi:predicted SprT family Zn-dependent metalloprotease
MDEIPRSFWLMGQKITVSFSDKLATDNGALGQSFFNSNTIKIQRPTGSFEISNDQLELTFYHELVHFILHTMGQNELNNNEQFVDMFGNLLVQFLRTKKGTLKCKNLKPSS